MNKISQISKEVFEMFTDMFEISLILIGMLDIFTEMLKILTELMRYQQKCLRSLPKYDILTKMSIILIKIFGSFNNG